MVIRELKESPLRSSCYLPNFIDQNIQDMKGKADKWEFYKDHKLEWRWRRKSANIRIVGAATEGYKNKKDCMENARRNGYKG